MEKEKRTFKIFTFCILSSLNSGERMALSRLLHVNSTVEIATAESTNTTPAGKKNNDQM